MNSKAPTLRKFKDFHGNHLSTIGNYGQDCKTGNLLASHFYNIVKTAIQFPNLKDNTQLKKITSGLPKGEHYDGLIIGLFSQLSAYFEPLIKGNIEYGKATSRDDLLSQLAECAEYQDQFRQKIKQLIKQWFINFSKAVNSPEHGGCAHYLLSDLVLSLPESLYFAKNCYAWFCYELTLLLSKLMHARGQ